jgi:hypothetical protein
MTGNRGERRERETERLRIGGRERERQWREKTEGVIGEVGVG